MFTGIRTQSNIGQQTEDHGFGDYNFKIMV